MKLPHRAMEQHARGRWREALLSLLLLLNPACGRRPGVQPGQVVTSSVALCNLGGGACLPEQEQQVGLLRFNGGLHLTSGNANFGGLSAIRVSAYPPSTSSSAVDTVSHPLQFVAVTDQAMLVTGVLRHDRNGWLTDVDEVSIGHLLDGNGDEISGMDPSTGLDLTDAESLAASSETDPLHGDLLVSFERLHRVLRYQMGNHSNPFDAVPEPVLGLGAHNGRISQCAENGGVEAMELLHSGALLVLCEEPLPIVPADEGPNAVHSAPGWLLPDPSASNTYRVDLLLATDERPVAMARIPRWHGEGRGTSNARVEDGLLVLMRSWSRERGNVLRLLFIDDPVLSAVDLSGVVHQDSRSDRNQVCALDGAVVAEMNRTRHTVDNFEGLAVIALPNGLLRVYIVSDNNFSPSQRTLLHSFLLNVSDLASLPPTQCRRSLTVREGSPIKQGPARWIQAVGYVVLAMCIAGGLILAGNLVRRRRLQRFNHNRVTEELPTDLL